MSFVSRMAGHAACRRALTSPTDTRTSFRRIGGTVNETVQTTTHAFRSDGQASAHLAPYFQASSSEASSEASLLSTQLPFDIRGLLTVVGATSAVGAQGRGQGSRCGGVWPLVDQCSEKRGMALMPCESNVAQSDMDSSWISLHSVLSFGDVRD